MTGVINKTARQLDMRALDNGQPVHVVLNPGFNIVDDETWKVLLTNKHNQVLLDEEAIVAGKKRKEDVEAEQEAAANEAKANQLGAPTGAAGVVKTEAESKDPNINPETGKAWTAKEKKARDEAAKDNQLDL